jgi:hypothetical protein
MPSLPPAWLADFHRGKGDKAEGGDKTKIAKPHRLFLISDVVKEILLCLEMRPLINCQRVCRLWHDIIEASDALQEALFLKASQRQISSSNPNGRNPLVEELIWPNLRKYKEAQWLKRRRFGKNKKLFFLRRKSIPSTGSQLETNAAPATSYRSHRNNRVLDESTRGAELIHHLPQIK